LIDTINLWDDRSRRNTLGAGPLPHLRLLCVY
jgi:hypothetical protein